MHGVYGWRILRYEQSEFGEGETNVSACGYVQKNQRFTRSGNLYGELDATNEMSAEKEKRTRP